MANITYSDQAIGTVLNEDGGSTIDFRVEGDTDANLLFVDASADAIAIGNNAPTSFLHLKASTTAKSSLRIPVGTAPTSPNEGDIYNDTTFKHLMAFIDGIKQGLNGTIFRQTQTVTVNTTNAETTLVGTGEGTVTLPANFFTVGKTIRVTASGWYGTTGTPTNAVRLKYGTTTILQSSGDALSAGIGNDRMWRMQAEFTCRSVGAAGTVIGEGTIAYWNGGSTNRPYAMQTLTTITIDTTTSNALGLTTQFSVSDVANTMTCALLAVEVL